MAIGLADLATTILFIQHHGAEEANPLFKRYWEMGLAAFVGAKVVLLVGPLSVLEWARHRNPRFVSWALRGAIVAYLVMYGIGYVRLNHSTRPELDIADLSMPGRYFPLRVAERVHPVRRSIRQTTTVPEPEAVGARFRVY